MESLPSTESLPKNHIEPRKEMIEKIYRSALDEHTEYKNIPEAEIKEVISNALSEIERLERAAHYEIAEKAMSKEVAENIVALWDFSGPGSYGRKEKDEPNPRLANDPWLQVMEHERLSYTTWLERTISEKKANVPKRDGVPPEGIRERKEDTKELIREFGPTIIYNGTEAEIEMTKKLLSETGIIIPEEKVIFPSGTRVNTVDQIKTFKIPEELDMPGKEIGLISHEGHLMRIAHMLEHYKPLPPDMKVRLFPVQTTLKEKDEHHLMEIRGLLYYIYITQPHHASKEPYPYIIHGEKEVDEEKQNNLN